MAQHDTKYKRAFYQLLSVFSQEHLHSIQSVIESFSTKTMRLTAHQVGKARQSASSSFAGAPVEKEEHARTR